MPAPQNQLIASLPPRTQQRLLAQCDLVTLEPRALLFAPGLATPEGLYFPVSGCVALLACADEHAGLEVGLVGQEGLVGLHLALGQHEPHLRAEVQAPGQAWYLPAHALRHELVQSPPLRHCLDAYLLVRMTQLATAATCMRFHLIRPRLARWLLMCLDRAPHNQFQVTHERLAHLLGVRRVGVTTAAGQMQRAGLIHYHRGELTVQDRDGLEASACSCYRSDRETYASLLR